MSGTEDLEDLADDALVERLRASGAERYFAEITRRHWVKVLHCCRRRLGDASLAEDLAQETFKRAFTEIHRFNGGNLAAWLCTIAQHLCINHLKSRPAREIAAIEDSDGIVSPADFESDLLTKDEVEAVLSRLSTKQRVCLKLLYMEGLTYREIAAVTRYTERDVTSFVQNGKLRFRDDEAGGRAGRDCQL